MLNRLLPNSRAPGNRPRGGRVLGVALGERSLVVAEVQSGRAGGAELDRAAEFPYPEGVGLQQPDVLGQALGAFLKDKGFTARRAVFGMPAWWALSKPKVAPPAAPEVVAESLRLQGEGEFSSELKDLVLDFEGTTSETESTSVLLLAVQRSHLDTVKSLAKAARLTPEAVLPTVTALAAAGNSEDEHAAPEGMVLSLSSSGAELTARRGDGPTLLKFLGAAGRARELALNVQRAMPMFPPALPGAAVNGNGAANGSAKPNGSGRELTLWETAGPENPGLRDALREALGVTVRNGDLKTLGLSPPRQTTEGAAPARGASYAPAAALALAGLSPEGPPLDLLRPRLAAPVKPRFERRTLIAAAVVAGVLLIGVAAWAVVRSRESRLEDLRAQNAALDPSVKRAKATVAKADYAARWNTGNPHYLACLRDLTEVVPENTPNHLISFNLAETPQGAFQGSFVAKAANMKTARDLRERLGSHPRFKNVVSPSLESRDATGRFGRDRGGENQELTYTVKFTYVPTAPARAAPQAAPAAAPRASARAGQ